MILMSSHLFNIVHEGFNEPWYFSEKLWDAYLARTVPIIVSETKQLREEHILPSGSYIDAAQFSTAKELAEYLKQLAADPAKYEQFFRWKSKPLPTGFLIASQHTWEHYACNLCAHASA